MLVIHLSDKQLDAAIGSPGVPSEVHTFASLKQLRGSVRDGIIVDPAGFREAVEPFWKENSLPTNDVKVVLDTTHFMQRTMDAPVFKKPAELEDYLRREILSLGRISNPLFTYEVTGTGTAENTQKLDLIIIEAQVIERLLNAFEKFGVKVTSVVSATLNINQALLAMGKTVQVGGTTMVITATEDKVLSVLEQGGTYRYGTTQQLFNEYGSAGFANEVARNVTNTQQFMSAQNIAPQLDRVRLVGLTPEAEAACKDAISAVTDGVDVVGFALSRFGKIGPNVTADHPDDALGRVFPMIMALCVPNAGRRIVTALTGEGDKKSLSDRIPAEARPIVTALIPAGIALVVCLVAFIGVSAWNGTVQSQVDSANKFLATDAAKTQLAAYNKAQENVDASSAEVTAARTLTSSLAQFPKPTSEVNRVLDQCAEGLVTVTPVSYDSSTGIYTVTAKSSDYSTIYQFINKVIATNKYGVQYEGYSYNEATVRGGVSGTGAGAVVLDDGSWQLTLNLILPANTQEG